MCLFCPTPLYMVVILCRFQNGNCISNFIIFLMSHSLVKEKVANWLPSLKAALSIDTAYQSLKVYKLRARGLCG